MIQKKAMINFKLNIYVYAHHILKDTNIMVFLAFVSFLSMSVYILGFLYKSELLLEKEISFCISSSSGEFSSC